MSYTAHLHDGPADGEVKQMSTPYPKLHIAGDQIVRDQDGTEQYVVAVYERASIEGTDIHYRYTEPTT